MFLKSKRRTTIFRLIRGVTSHYPTCLPLAGPMGFLNSRRACVLLLLFFFSFLSWLHRVLRVYSPRDASRGQALPGTPQKFVSYQGAEGLGSKSGMRKREIEHDRGGGSLPFSWCFGQQTNHHGIPVLTTAITGAQHRIPQVVQCQLTFCYNEN